MKGSLFPHWQVSPSLDVFFCLFIFFPVWYEDIKFSLKSRLHWTH